VHRRKDGAIVPVEISTNYFIYDGVEYITGYIHDITERKRAEQELQEADRRKNEFLATLAHELRNPLAPIRNSVQVMRLHGLPDPDLRTAQEIIERQVQQMSRLVDDLLDISRISRGMVELRRQILDLRHIIYRSREMSQPLIDERLHQLTVSLPEEPLPVDGDATRLEQILGNLLNNSAKYTEPGGRISLTAVREGDEAVVRVRDTGIGMSADFLTQAFEIFVQAGEQDAARGGLGIGLSLVRRFVEMHGGSVSAYSDGPGHGSEFVVRLPLVKAPTPPVAEPAPPQQKLPRSARRVLVVDDNVDAANSLAMLLQIDGHEVQVTHDGRGALEAVAATPPEFIFLDIGLPGIDGYEVARRIRQQMGPNHLVLIALTGWGQEEDRQRSKEAGFDYHFVKPVEPEEWRALLSAPQPVSTLT
jgi:CheY-like chemotaxis protein/nitrogen-specific signal transduction histidine kinase